VTVLAQLTSNHPAVATAEKGSQSLAGGGKPAPADTDTGNAEQSFAALLTAGQAIGLEKGVELADGASVASADGAAPGSGEAAMVAEGAELAGLLGLRSLGIATGPAGQGDGGKTVLTAAALPAPVVESSDPQQTIPVVGKAVADPASAVVAAMAESGSPKTSAVGATSVLPHQAPPLTPLTTGTGDAGAGQDISGLEVHAAKTDGVRTGGPDLAVLGKSIAVASDEPKSAPVGERAAGTGEGQTIASLANTGDQRGPHAENGQSQTATYQPQQTGHQPLPATAVALDVAAVENGDDPSVMPPTGGVAGDGAEFQAAADPRVKLATAATVQADAGLPRASAPPASVRAQVIGRLLQHDLKPTGNTRLSLQLEPAHLGKLEIRLETSGKDLTVIFNVASAEAEKALQEGRQELIDAIVGRTGRWESVEVKLERQENNAREQQSRDRQASSDRNKDRDDQRQQESQPEDPERPDQPGADEQGG